MEGSEEGSTTRGYLWALYALGDPETGAVVRAAADSLAAAGELNSPLHRDAFDVLLALEDLSQFETVASSVREGGCCASLLADILEIDLTLYPRAEAAILSALADRHIDVEEAIYQIVILRGDSHKIPEPGDPRAEFTPAVGAAFIEILDAPGRDRDRRDALRSLARNRGPNASYGGKSLVTRLEELAQSPTATPADRDAVLELAAKTLRWAETVRFVEKAAAGEYGATLASPASELVEAEIEVRSPVILGGPWCGDRPATIYVRWDIITGGPDDGQPYTGTLTGTTGLDVIVGTDGDDTLFGLQGDDVLCGGAGDDVLRGSAGDDRLDGGLGNDEVRGDAGRDLLVGGDGDDDLRGGGDADTLRGGAGNDRLTGAAGNDALWGEDGADVLLGNGGDDTLSGGPGDDTLEGGSGDDTLTGDAGTDDASGGGGTDACDAETERSCETDPQ